MCANRETTHSPSPRALSVFPRRTPVNGCCSSTFFLLASCAQTTLQPQPASAAGAVNTHEQGIDYLKFPCIVKM